MPKPSLLKKDNAAGAGFGFGEGRGRILDLKCVAHQYAASKKTGDQQAPACFLFVTIDRTDADGKSLGEDPTTDELKIGELEYFHPGQLKTPDGDPEDLGRDLGTEGNSIWADGTKKFGQSAKGKVFLDSIEDAGFKAEIIARCYLPDYIGLLADFEQTTVTPTGGTKKIDPYQCLAVTKILEFPYDRKGPAVAVKAASGKPAAGKAGTAKEPETTAASNGSAGDAEDIATACLASLLEGWAGKTQDVAKLSARSFTYCGKLTDENGKPAPAPPKTQTAVSKFLSDPKWVTATGGPMGITVEGTAVTFPEAD